MLTSISYKRIFLTMLTLVGVILFLSRCIQNDAGKSSGSATRQVLKYAGSLVCKDCHKDIYESHLNTFHNQTSALATTQNIKGSFEQGRNRFYFNPALYIAVEKKDSGLFQTAYQRDIAKVSRPFDFVVGSGKRGQTFLYWHNNYIFQLPLTYFTSTGEWTNSPGYSNKVQFNRPITARCLECHSTFFKEETIKDAKADQFSKSNIILGVGCEKCHGPSSEHIAYQQKNPHDTTGKFIINPSSLTRTQNLDLCRSCHGGRLSKTKPSFSFIPGDKLADFFNLDSVNTDISNMDVHGNQYGMLSASKCFKMSTMTCGTCHSPHTNESNQLNVFAGKCLTCHTNISNKLCKISRTVTPDFLKLNCIGCHMPEQESKTIMVLRQGESIPTAAIMRSHYISVYQQEAKKRLEKEKLKKVKS